LWNDTETRWCPIIEDEPPIKDCPPFKQDDEHEPRVRAWLGDQHERDIQEMAGRPWMKGMERMMMSSRRLGGRDD